MGQTICPAKCKQRAVKIYPGGPANLKNDAHITGINFKSKTNKLDVVLNMAIYKFLNKLHSSKLRQINLRRLVSAMICTKSSVFLESYLV